MNRRQKKKAFKKRFGFNPPRNIPIKTAIKVMERRGEILKRVEKLKVEIMDLWENTRAALLQFVDALKELGTAFITVPEWERGQRWALKRLQMRLRLQQRQQESEAKQIEGNSDIYNHNRG